MQEQINSQKTEVPLALFALADAVACSVILLSNLMCSMRVVVVMTESHLEIVYTVLSVI
jgi:hypothetical protein